MAAYLELYLRLSSQPSIASLTLICHTKLKQIICMAMGSIIAR